MMNKVHLIVHTHKKQLALNLGSLKKKYVKLLNLEKSIWKQAVTHQESTENMLESALCCWFSVLQRGQRQLQLTLQ